MPIHLKSVPPIRVSVCLCVCAHRTRLIAVIIAASGGLALFGFLGSALGGARVLVGALRVLIGGWLAMAVTYGIGYAFGVGIA